MSHYRIGILMSYLRWISSSILNILLGEIIGFIMTCDVNSEKRIIKIIPFNNMLKINNSSFMVSLHTND